MISKSLIENLVAKGIENTDIFLISISISTANKIRVSIDSMKGLPIDSCVRVSRAIEGGLDREEDDFELEVSSSGLDKSLEVPKQYIKNIGRKLKVELENEVLKGTIKDFKEDVLFLEVLEKRKDKKHKKTIKELKMKEININTIKSAKVEVSFK